MKVILAQGKFLKLEEEEQRVKIPVFGMLKRGTDSQKLFYERVNAHY